MRTANATVPHGSARYEVRYHLVDDVHIGSGRFLTYAADPGTAREAKKTWSRNDNVSVIWIIDRNTGKRVD